ncbi:hypothetical protein D7X32_03620 [Corallococcus carmarthensis]|uniref:Uncharacterized protein n=2 Tax=Corallococcus carmarthensis TaxID=2316728 RepID=A0A3A8KFI2_9BACT|nr:hypothetical protein D7X32_03620 [Corallococcus carmarthensis]
MVAALTATGAHAAPTVLTCPLGVTKAHYEPGMTLQSKPTTVTSQGLFALCSGIPADIGSAEFDYTAKGNVACTASSITGGFKVKWGNGQTSTVANAQVTTARPQGLVVSTVTGKVTEGLFLGQEVVHTVTLLQSNLLGCETTRGVTDVSGLSTLTVLGL